MCLCIYLLAALAAAMVLIFSCIGEIILHLMAAGWAGTVILVFPSHVVHWYYRRRQEAGGWRKHCRPTLQATLFVGWVLLVVLLLWPQYAVWFSLLP